MIRTFRYPLRPTKVQAATMESWLGYCCDLYNAGLEHRISAWKRDRKTVDYNAQTAELAELRAIDDQSRAVPSVIARSALRRLECAYQAFFRRCKSGETPGFPRFRNRRRYDSFGIGRTAPEGDRIWVQKLGLIRFHLYRPLRGEVRNVTIRRTCDRWYVCFACEVGPAPAKLPAERAVGIDLGLTTFAVTSEGERFANPRHFRRGEEGLAHRQRRFSRRRRGSKGQRRARLLVAKAYRRITNQRLDHARKMAAALVRRYDLIAVEALSIEPMMQTNLSKSVRDAAWRIFLTCLSLKAEEAGVTVVEVDPRGTSQRCSGCGETVTKTLWDRVHGCPSCGLVLDRDHNAAINILNLGYSPGRGEAAA